MSANDRLFLPGAGRERQKNNGEPSTRDAPLDAGRSALAAVWSLPLFHLEAWVLAWTLFIWMRSEHWFYSVSVKGFARSITSTLAIKNKPIIAHMCFTVERSPSSNETQRWKILISILFGRVRRGTKLKGLDWARAAGVKSWQALDKVLQCVVEWWLDYTDQHEMSFMTHLISVVCHISAKWNI